MGSSATNSILIFSMRFSICFRRFSVIGIAYMCYTRNATTILRNCRVNVDPTVGIGLVVCRTAGSACHYSFQPIDGGRMEVSAILNRFMEQSPIPVMARSLLERVLTPAKLNNCFKKGAKRQYTRDLLFSSAFELMSMVVMKSQPSVNAAYQSEKANIGVRSEERRVGKEC